MEPDRFPFDKEAPEAEPTTSAVPAATRSLRVPPKWDSAQKTALQRLMMTRPDDLTTPWVTIAKILRTETGVLWTLA